MKKCTQGIYISEIELREHIDKWIKILKIIFMKKYSDLIIKYGGNSRLLDEKILIIFPKKLGAAQNVFIIILAV